MFSVRLSDREFEGLQAAAAAKACSMGAVVRLKVFGTPVKVPVSRGAPAPAVTGEVVWSTSIDGPTSNPQQMRSGPVADAHAVLPPPRQMPARRPNVPWEVDGDLDDDGWESA